MIQEIYKFVKILGPLSAALFIPVKVYSFTNNVMFGYLAAGLISLGALIYIGYRNFAYINNIRRGYAPRASKSIVIKRTTAIEIDKDFRAKIAISRKVIFLQKPEPSDLVDLYESMKGASFSELDYQSPDADFVSSYSPKSQLISVHWKPKKDIDPLVEYRHSFSYVSPMLFGEDGFYYSTYIDKTTGVCEYDVTAYRRIERATAFMMPKHRIAVTEKVLYKLGFDSKRKTLAQPIISNNGKTLRWKMQNPEIGRTYIIFALYEGEVDAFKNRLMLEARGAFF